MTDDGETTIRRIRILAGRERGLIDALASGTPQRSRLRSPKTTRTRELELAERYGFTPRARKGG
jgi:hypothetical protein